MRSDLQDQPEASERTLAVNNIDASQLCGLLKVSWGWDCERCGRAITSAALQKLGGTLPPCPLKRSR